MARERRKIVCDASRRLAEHSSGDRQSIVVPEGLKMWNPNKAGVYTIDIIPYQLTEASSKFVKNYRNPGEWHYERTYHVHADIGVNDDKFTCPAKNFGHKCPICEFRNAKGVSPKKEDQDLVYSLKPKERQLYLIYDWDQPQKGLQLWEISYYCFGKQLDNKIQNASPKKQAIYKRFAEPEEGSTLRLVATSEPSGGGGSFIKFTVDEFQERDRPVPDELYDHEFVLDTIVREPSYEELKKVFFQVGEEAEEGKERSERGVERGEDRAERTRRSRDDDDDRGGRRSRDEEESTRRSRRDEEEEEKSTTRSRRDEEEKPAGKKKDWQKGDEVSFEFRDDVLTGTIVKINDETKLASVEVKGKDRPLNIDLDELKPATGKKKEEEEPSRRSRDDEPRRTRRDEEEESPRSRRSRDEDEPPARGKKEEEKEASSRSRGKADAWDDDDDDRSFKRRGKEDEDKKKDDDEDKPARGRSRR